MEWDEKEAIMLAQCDKRALILMYSDAYRE
jgi:hypothetical protein